MKINTYENPSKVKCVRCNSIILRAHVVFSFANRVQTVAVFRVHDDINRRFVTNTRLNYILPNPTACPGISNWVRRVCVDSTYDLALIDVLTVTVNVNNNTVFSRIDLLIKSNRLAMFQSTYIQTMIIVHQVSVAIVFAKNQSLFDFRRIFAAI